MCGNKWEKARKGKPQRVRVCWELLIAGFGAYSLVCLLGLAVQRAVEGICLLLWSYSFTHLFSRRPSPPLQFLQQSSLVLLSLIISVFTFSYLLQSILPSGLLSSLALLAVYFVLLLRNLDQEGRLEQEPVAVPGLHRKVVSDCQPIKELMDYLGTLEGGKVNLPDFLPVLQTLCPDLPVYVGKTINRMQASKTLLVTYQEILQSANDAYMLETKSRAPAKYIAT